MLGKHGCFNIQVSNKFTILIEWMRKPCNSKHAHTHTQKKGKIQYPNMIKFQQTRNKKELLQCDKSHLWRTCKVSTYLMVKYPKLRTRQRRIPALIVFTQHCTKGPSQGNKPNKRGHRD